MILIFNSGENPGYYGNLPKASQSAPSILPSQSGEFYFHLKKLRNVCQWKKNRFLSKTSLFILIFFNTRHSHTSES